jgi:hypothetical protein
MGRIDTGLDIAAMQHLHIVWNWSEMQPPREPMRGNNFVASDKSTATELPVFAISGAAG